jgi:3-(3-hydroxy-phenyl)propionate hydroxylase
MENDSVAKIQDDEWGNACTRGMLGVRLDVDGRGDWSMVKYDTEPAVRPGDRIPDWQLYGPAGRDLRVHDLTADRFAALYFTDARRKPSLPPDTRSLAHHVVSRWDAPLDSGVRDRALLDPAGAFQKRLGVAADTLLLVRPDEHIAAISPIADGLAARLYEGITGKAPE